MSKTFAASNNNMSNNISHPITPASSSAIAGSGSTTATRLFVEDGWIFSECPGKPVACVGRGEAEDHQVMTPPNQVRHHYPST
jgi:hypothetical protein